MCKARISGEICVTCDEGFTLRYHISITPEVPWFDLRWPETPLLEIIVLPFVKHFWQIIMTTFSYLTMNAGWFWDVSPKWPYWEVNPQCTISVYRVYNAHIEQIHARSIKFFNKFVKYDPPQRSHHTIFTSCVQGLSDACDWAGLNYEAWDAVADQIGGVAEPRCFHGWDGINHHLESHFSELGE